MSKLNIFKKDWVDIVFEGRNKSYGAYQLRSENPKVTTKALFLGIALFGLAIASPVLLDKLKGKFADNEVKSIDELVETIDVELPKDIPPPPPPPIEETPPPPVEDVKSINDTKKLTELVVDKKENVKEEITKQEEFKKDTEVGSKEAKGSADGEVKIKDKTGELDLKDKKEQPASDDGGNGIVLNAAVPAEFPGGMGKFNSNFISRFRAPEMDAGTKSIRVIVTFVVEKDGSLTDIKILRDPGFGVGKEAIRVLNAMPKWKAAEQGGKKVRSQFTLPITVQVQ